MVIRDLIHIIGADKGISFLKNIAIHLRLYYPYNLVFMNKMRRNKQEELNRSRVYYSDNKDRIERILSFLSDKKSKETWLSIIRLRQTYSKKYIPTYNYFNQYFPKDVPEFASGDGYEVFVDCGAYIGDTAKKFSKKFKYYKSIVLFEPDERNIKKIKKTKLQNVHLIPSGCSDYDGTAMFSMEDDSGGSSIVNDSEECIKMDDSICNIDVKRIDSIGECSDATFIKMDIEGAEMSALRGAEETIKKNHPKLAICLYHSDSDMIDIPEYIHSIVPEYSMFVRAHTMGIAETVLYCVDRSRN